MLKLWYTTITLQAIENNTRATTTCTATATLVLPTDDDDQDGNEPKELESADECFTS